MEWIKTVLNAVRAAVDGVSARVDRLKSRVKSVEDWVKSLDWVPVVKPVDETLLPETTLDYDSNATFTAPMPTVGLTYTVTIGQKTYEAEAWEYSVKDSSAVCIGKYMLDADSTDQFIFLWGLGDAAGQRLFITVEGVTDGKVTVSIARKSENENELPDVFLWSLKKRVAKNESAISDTSTKITELEESVNTATDDVSSMKTTVKSLQTSLSNKADKSSPVFTGSFSQNRKAGTTVAYGSHTEGLDCQATDRYCHAEGYETASSGANYGASHAEGYETIASGDASHAEGWKTTASGAQSHAEGTETTASGNYSHAEGKKTTASYFSSHAEGQETKATSSMAHAEGYMTEASNECSHAEGEKTKASGKCSHAEGSETKALGNYSHAEGIATEAGNYAHAEGASTKATGMSSHAEGGATTAEGTYSHAEGRNTTATTDEQHVEGRFNIPDQSGKYAHIVGNGHFGQPDNVYSNAHTLDWAGVPWFHGRPQFGGTAQDDGSQSVVANGDKEFILASSTEGSTKKFKVTVDDSGVLTATEITA